MIEFTLNGSSVNTDDNPDTPLLWVIRDTFKLKGSKFGCGAGLCGACTMHVNGQAVRTCVLPISEVAGKNITTIEGLATDDSLHPVQQAFLDEGAMQCGYCTPGMILTAVALLKNNPNPTDDDITAAMNGNLCRCNGYPKILNAIRRAAGQ